MIRYICAVWLWTWLSGLAGIPAENYYNQGNRWYRAGRYDLAEGAYRHAAQGERVRVKALFNAGNAAFQRGEYTRAMDDYTQVLELDPLDPDAWHNLELARRKANPEGNEEQVGAGARHAKERTATPEGLTGGEDAAGSTGREDIFSLPPEALADYLREQTQAGYPFRPGSSVRGPKEEKQDDVVDW
jgi:tetratricopeptide (TPR) repeat protein